MVKKIKATADKKKNASGSKLFDSALASSVKEQAQQIWLAGMGAFAKAQAEGKQVFEALVKEGASLQKKTQTVAEEKFGEVTGRMSSMAGDVTSKAGQHWDKLESIFEDRTARALKKLGVPSSKDVQAMMDRIDALSAQVAEKSATSTAKTAPTKTATTTAAKTPARKSTVKRASVKVAKTATKTSAKKSAARRVPARPAAKTA